MDSKILEKKKMELELKRVETARMDIEVRIMSAEEDIKRLEDHVQVQLKKEEELKKKLGEL